MPEVPADMSQRRAATQQAGGQGVPGLVGDVVTEVEGVHPGPESLVEPGVAQRPGVVGVAALAGEQGERGAFGTGGPATVPGGEPVQGLGLPGVQDVEEALGNADRGIEV